MSVLLIASIAATIITIARMRVDGVPVMEGEVCPFRCERRNRSANLHGARAGRVAILDATPMENASA